MKVKAITVLVLLIVMLGILMMRSADAGIPSCREAREAKYVGRCIAFIDQFGVITGD